MMRTGFLAALFGFSAIAFADQENRPAANTTMTAVAGIRAGAGATVGKFGGGRPMKAGVGSAAVVLSNGLIVGAIVAVNAVGDIIDPANGTVVAGVRGSDGRLADARRLLRSGQTVTQP